MEVRLCCCCLITFSVQYKIFLFCTQKPVGILQDKKVGVNSQAPTLSQATGAQKALICHFTIFYYILCILHSKIFKIIIKIKFDIYKKNFCRKSRVLNYVVLLLARSLSGLSPSKSFSVYPFFLFLDRLLPWVFFLPKPKILQNNHILYK